MFDIYSKRSNNWFFSGKWKITPTGIITLYMNALPLNNKIVLITKKDLFMR